MSDETAFNGTREDRQAELGGPDGFDKRQASVTDFEDETCLCETTTGTLGCFAHHDLQADSQQES